MSGISISPFGSVTVASLASSVISVQSKGSVSVYQQVSAANHPSGWTLLGTTTNTETQYSITTASNVRIDAGAQEVLYAAGTAAVILERRGLRTQDTPGVLNATGALTAAMMASGIVTSTTAAAVAGTVPTGTVLDAAFLDMQIGESFDWSVIATGANAFTVTAATGHTLVGVAVVATVTSGLFRTRKTAAATYITYRLG